MPADKSQKRLNMKTTMITCTALMIGSLLQAQTTDLTLTISNFKNADGKVRASIYSRADTYLKEARYSADTIVYNEAEVLLVFKNLPVGEYAISIYHDENGNGELDANFMGIPTEPYAFSNNAPSRFGPAKYADAKFTINSATSTHAIQLN